MAVLAVSLWAVCTMLIQPNGQIDEAVTVCFTDKNGLASRRHAIHLSEFDLDTSFDSNQINPRRDSDSEAEFNFQLP
jgi:hypothetical protein